MIEIQKSTTTTADYEGLSFVLKALSTDETRPFMMVVHIEKRKRGITAVATDGKRMHTADLDLDVAPGDYVPLITKASVILKPSTGIQFPDWKRVFPKVGTEITMLDFSSAGIGKKNTQCANMTQQVLKLYEKTHQAVNMQFLDDLSKGPWTVYGVGGTSRAVLLKRTEGELERSAVLMPMEMAA